MVDAPFTRQENAAMDRTIRLGVDTLCWHLRLEQGELSLEDVLDEAAELGAECVQVNLHHARDRDLAGLRALALIARSRRLVLLASGDFLGEGRSGDEPSVGVGRVGTWLERAVALGSPFLRVVSGFYRAELFGRPDLIEAERRYVIAVLREAAARARDTGIVLLLENHSDFTAEEYASIVEEVGGGDVGVFLDLINPIAALDDPVPVIERLAPLARAGHVKDYVFRSLPTDDGYHRRGFEVLYRYPGEGVADLAALTAALRRGLGGREFFLTVEGLDSRAGLDDQRERLAPSLALLRSLTVEEAGQ
jgi:sugar phosphate isomerase/epimerase